MRKNGIYCNFEQTRLNPKCLYVQINYNIMVYYTFLKNIFNVLLPGKLIELEPPKQKFLFTNSSVADYTFYVIMSSGYFSLTPRFFVSILC